MKIGLIGRKRGMTRVFTEQGNSVPVTVIEVSPNRVTQVKDLETDGYRSIQVTIGQRRASLVNKPVAGHYAKAGVEAGEGLWELRLPEGEAVEAGSELKVDMFEAGEMVDVTGTSKGKGFAGTIKRWNFSRGPMSHGGMNKRAPGSIGCSATPARVIKGRKMPGQMGNRRATVKGLMVVDVRPEENIILIRGAVPGGRNGVVFIKKSGKF